MDNRFHSFFMACAFEASKLSRAERSKVGAILVKENRIVATGYNGQPYNFDNCCEIKNEDGSLTTKPTVVHAELNIILFCARHGIPTNNTSLYVTMSPCISCAISLIQAGIKTIFYSEEYRDTSGIELLKEAGIEILKWKK